MPTYNAVVSQSAESRFNEHTRWSHSLVGPLTTVEFVYPAVTSRVQLTSSNGGGIVYKRGYKWMSGDSTEYGTATVFRGRGYHDGSWSSWSSPDSFNLNATSGSYSQSNQMGYSSANAWAAGQFGASLAASTFTFTGTQLSGSGGYQQFSTGTFALIYDTQSKRFATGAEAIAAGQTTISSTSSPAGGGDRFVLVMIVSADEEVLDAIAPTVTISPNATIVTNASNQNCTKDDPASITVSAVDNSGGVGVKSVTIDGTEYTTASKTVTYTGDQLHTVTASSKDYIDNTSADSTYSFLIDTTAPTVAVSVDSSTGTAVTVGSNEYYNTDTIVIKIDTSDSGSGLDDGTLTVNGTDTAFATVPTTTSYTTTLTSSEGIVEGKNTVKYTSKDIVGNEASAEVDFFVDTTSPTGFIVISTQDSVRENNSTLYTKDTNVNVNLHFGDSGTDPSGVSKGLVKINDSATPVVADFASGIDLSSETSPKNDHNVTNLTTGQSNDLSFFVMDAVENISTVDTVSITVDNVLPSGTIAISTSQDKNDVSSISYANTVDLKVKLEHSDADSGLF